MKMTTYLLGRIAALADFSKIRKTLSTLMLLFFIEGIASQYGSMDETYQLNTSVAAYSTIVWIKPSM